MTGLNSIILAAALAWTSCVLQGCGGGDSTTTTTAAPPGSQTIPEIAEAAADLSTLVAALKAGDLVGTLGGKGPFTVFAPNDEAFAALGKELLAALLKKENKAKLVEILTYHVHSGKVLSSALKNGEIITTLDVPNNLTVSIKDKTVMINTATVVKADVLASNGVVHIINKVLIPTGFVPPATQSIPEIATGDKDLSLLVAALSAADLVKTLGAAGPFTVFAPTNEAFTALNKSVPGVLDNLLKPANKDLLVKVLEYHVHSGEVLASQLKNGEKVPTLEGQNVNVTITGKTVMINTANVTKADVMAVNGVVHIIDAVLIYPGFKPPSATSEMIMNEVVV